MEKVIQMRIGKGEASSGIEHGDGDTQGVQPVQQPGGIAFCLAHSLSLHFLQDYLSPRQGRSGLPGPSVPAPGLQNG